MSGKTGTYNLRHRISGAFQTVDKPLCFLKMGSQGRQSPYSPPARMPGVYAQMLYARTHTSGRTKSVQDALTTNDHDCTDAKPTKHTQPFTGKRGFRQGCRNKDTPSFARSKANRVS